MHDASQSVDEEAEEDDADPSVDEDDEELEVHDALHPPWHRELQSVVQSREGGLVEQLVVQLDEQLETQLASADAVHCESHCCSSCAAHACSQLGGAHCVVQGPPFAEMFQFTFIICQY